MRSVNPVFASPCQIAHKAKAPIGELHKHHAADHAQEAQPNRERCEQLWAQLELNHREDCTRQGEADEQRPVV